MTRNEVKRIFKSATKCAIQYTGWTCGTCFFGLYKKLTNADWQSLLYFRGDYKKNDLDNLPKDWRERIERLATRLAQCETSNGRHGDE